MIRDLDLLKLETDWDNNRPDRFRRPRKKKKAFKFISYVIAVGFIVIFVFTSRVIMSEDNSIMNTLSFLGQIKHLAQTSDNMLKGEEENRINVLLLGIGGRGHEGGLLTDTIMLASIIPETGEVALLSIPRDMIVPIDGYGWRKINNVNAYAEVEKPGSGGLAISQSLSRVLDIPIHYYVRVDFYGFEQIIDELGGVDIEVENTINDLSYPILGEEENESYENRFEHLYIEEGLHHMDGSLALKYSRSRHTAGIEGSDFARSHRQQQVLAAVKDKVTDLRILFKPKMISNILSTLEEHISTNVKIWEAVKMWNIVKDTSSEQITTKSLDNSPDGLLVDSITPDGAYVLEPRTGDFEEIQYLVKNIMTDVPPQQREAVSQEYPKLEIQNGTWVNGLAERTATDLKKFGFKIVRLDNANKQNYERSMIFDLTYGEKMDSLEILKERVDAKVYYGLPDWMIAELSEQNAVETELIQPDFILILGQTADKTKSGADNEENANQ